MSSRNPFSLERQVEAAANGEWSARKRQRRQRTLEAELASLVPKLAAAESTMRRAFAKWDKLRARAARIERELDHAFEERDG